MGESGARAIIAGEAFIPIQADEKPLIKGLNSAQKRLGGFVRFAGRGVGRVGAAFKTLGKSIGRVGKGLAVLGGVAVGAATAIVATFAKTNDNLAKTADAIGVNIEFLSDLRFAAERSGVSVGGLDTSLRRFLRQASDVATGATEAVDAFKDIGVEALTAAGKTKPTEQLLGEVAEAFSKIEDPAKRVRLSFELFGRSGVAMLNLFKEGKEGMADLTAEARRLNPITEEQARLAEDITDRYLDFKTAIIGVRNILATQLGPAFSSVIRSLTEWTVQAREGIDASGDLSATFLRIGGSIEVVAIAIGDLLNQTVSNIRKTITALDVLGFKFGDLKDSVVDVFSEALSEDAKRRIAEVRARVEKDISDLQSKGLSQRTRGIRGGTPGATQGQAQAGGPGGFGTFATRLAGLITPTLSVGEQQVKATEKVGEKIEKLTKVTKVAFAGPFGGGQFRRPGNIRAPSTEFERFIEGFKAAITNIPVKGLRGAADIFGTDPEEVARAAARTKGLKSFDLQPGDSETAKEIRMLREVVSEAKRELERRDGVTIR